MESEGPVCYSLIDKEAENDINSYSGFYIVADIYNRSSFKN